MQASTPKAERLSIGALKPCALRKGDRVAIFAPASPAQESRVAQGLSELRSIGFSPEDSFTRDSQAYFSASSDSRLSHFRSLLEDPGITALIALRGGYGSNYLLEQIWNHPPTHSKCVIGYSDVTSLQILLWQKLRWVSFYGPMVAAGLDAGANAAHGYDKSSLEAALFGALPRWKINLNGESMLGGIAEGTVLGGCLTLIETTLGTPWELDTAESILLLEDRGMKPWQIDRALMHLMQAGKFHSVKGIVLGEFPDCEPPVAGSPTAKDVCERILKPLGVPIVFGAAVGHTPRPMLTIPLGIHARISAEGSGTLEFLETAVIL
ncbi:MAG TPA: LD-carboxypeptidase [Candidatus Dormibacteraeota bacterium]|jgi:muramoyltetrapeptide carboxypeptidase|nr:LD-carboxypeptidase [Candidatus Dormibacteraeota bacterium]